MPDQPKSAPPKDLTALHQGYDIFHADLPVGSRLARALRERVRRILSPILLRQVDYNAASARLASHLWEETERLRQRQEDLVAEQAKLLQSVNARFSAHIEQLLEQQERGLAEARVLRLHPYPESSRVSAGGSASAERVNQLCYGARDYALLAFKR